MRLTPTAGQPRHKAVAKKNLLWAIPLALGAVLGAAVLALPGFVSSGYHRATIEALASSLTGRSVHMNGKLTLALLPKPEFIAGDVTITGADHETITAASLTLDIAPIALLRGRILARSIMLQSPHIAFPWPLPGGAAAIAPPLWLTALHAQINNGEVSLGAADFTHVSADIFTGGHGTFSVAGSGMLAGAPVALSLSFGALSAVGDTPLSLDIQTNNATQMRAHVSGSFDASSTLSGNIAFSAAAPAAPGPALPERISGAAAITADSQQIVLSSLKVQQGDATLAGTATLNLPRLALNLLLTGNNLTLPPSIGDLATRYPAFSVHLALNAVNTTIAALSALQIADLQTDLDFKAGEITISSFAASLAGAEVSMSGKVDSSGALHAGAVFNGTDLNTMFGWTGNAALPAPWDQAGLKFEINGNADHMTLNGLSGNFGPAQVTGNAVLARPDSLSGQLHFDQLALTPLIALLQNAPGGLTTTPGFSGDFEITADRATLDRIPLTHLLADASLGPQLVVRRLSATVYGGIAAASLTLSKMPGSAMPATQIGSAQIMSARAILAIPSAVPIAALLPAGLQLPSSLTKAPLALTLVAAGPATALATRASLTLGDVQITAAPTLDLVNRTATGGFTLRHPNAIKALRAFGLAAGLPWPGAGSIALRANLLLSPARMGFSDFVLSMGDLTGNGQLIYDASHQLNGEIDADTLALPPIPIKFTPAWADLANIQGNILISANRVLVAGDPILGATEAVIALNPGKFDLTLDQTVLAGGILNAEFSATLPSAAPAVQPMPIQPAPPAITAKFSLTGADAAGISLPFAFPLTVAAGKVDAAADLTARGYAPSAWLATLSGNASLAVHGGSLTGFKLPGLQTALTAPKNRAGQLRAACLTGATPFTDLRVTSNLNSGIVALDHASLQGPGGNATATGDIDLPDKGITLSLNLQPDVPAPPNLTLTLAGAWQAPHKIPAIKPALAWAPPAK